MLKIIPVKTDKDVELVKGLLEEYLAAWFDLDGPAHQKEAELFRRELANLAESFGPPEGFLLLASYAKEIAGCVALKKLSDSICEMKRLYVKPKFRGLKIGRNLAEAVIRHAQKIGYSQMRVQTASAMDEANELYKALGFCEIAPYEYSPRADAVFFELNLEQKKFSLAPDKQEMLKFNCDKCKSELKISGGLAFSPPKSKSDGTTGREVDKIHLCTQCWSKFLKWLEA